MGSPAVERRQSIRFRMGVPAAILLGAQQPIGAEIANLSEGGCYVRTRDTVPQGSRVSLRFQAAAHGLCAATGTVIRSADDGFAVQFTDVNRAFRNLMWDLESTDERQRAKIVTAIRNPEVTVVV